MTMMLNLDELASEATKTLVIEGVKHDAAELTVQAYVNRVRRAKSIDRETTTADVQIEETIKLLAEIFPTVDDSSWRRMPLRKLNAVIEFALAAPKEIAEQVESQVAAQAEQQGNA